MRYFVFDLDETLADMYSVYYFIASLKLDETNLQMFPKSLKVQLENAYDFFVEYVAQKEASDAPLGIIRPGIFEIMKELHTLKKEGKINGVIIYSNNGNLNNLEFVRDVIHCHLNVKKLIVECIHADHIIRKKRRLFYSNHSLDKRWDELKSIMTTCATRAPARLKPSDVFFFDDQDHTDLQNVLEDNYYKVPGYSYNAAIEDMIPLYAECLKQASVEMPLFVYYSIQTFVDKKSDFPFSAILVNSFESCIETLKHLFMMYTSRKNNHGIPLKDHAIDMMYDAINKVKDRTRAVKMNRKSIYRMLTYKRNK
jgi:hypothetical protein